jgi:hypothetical protein
MQLPFDNMESLLSLDREVDSSRRYCSHSHAYNATSSYRSKSTLVHYLLRSLMVGDYDGRKQSFELPKWRRSVRRTPLEGNLSNRKADWSPRSDAMIHAALERKTTITNKQRIAHVARLFLYSFLVDRLHVKSRTPAATRASLIDIYLSL